MDMDLNELMGVLQSDDGLKTMMLKPAFENDHGIEFSQAELIADVINSLRMDTKRLGQAVDVDIEANQMTPEKAAALLQGVAEGTDLGLIDVFDDIENKQMRILEELEGREEMEEYLTMKQSLLYTLPDEPENVALPEEDT